MTVGRAAAAEAVGTARCGDRSRLASWASGSIKERGRRLVGNSIATGAGLYALIVSGPFFRRALQSGRLPR